METWRSLFANGYFIADAMTMGGLSVATALVRNDQGMLGDQKAVMALMNTYTYGGLPGVFQDELAFFSFPVMDSALPVAEVIEPFGYVVPAGAEHIPAVMTFLEYMGSEEAQGFIAQQSMFDTIQYAPVRTDVAEERMTAQQRDMFTLLNEADETVVSLFYALPRSQFFGPVSYEFTRFVREPHDVDRFIQTLEEVRQKMVDQGLLYPEEG
jgi:ABC-type glycerol-3-phosphate transport system substrate-binding protein